MDTGSNKPDSAVEDFLSLVEELSEKAQALPKSAFDKIELIEKRGRSNRRWLWIVGFFSIALLLVGGLALSNTIALNHALNVQRVRACAFYTIFLQADTPQAREASPDKKAYDHAFEVIRDNYTALHCTDRK